MMQPPLSILDNGQFTTGGIMFELPSHPDAEPRTAIIFTAYLFVIIAIVFQLGFVWPA
jgi:hypothetical protein